MTGLWQSTMTGSIGTMTAMAAALTSFTSPRSAATLLAAAWTALTHAASDQPAVRADSSLALSVRVAMLVEPSADLRRQTSRSRDITTASSLSSCWPIHIGND